MSSIRARLAANWGWVVVLSSWFLYILLFGIMYSYGVLFVEFQKEFQSSATLTGWAGTIPIACTILLAPPMQVIIDRFGYRPVAVASLVLASSGVVATSFVPNILFVYLTYSFMYGCGSGATFLASYNLIVQYFPSKNCVRALALVFSGTSMGMLVIAPLYSFLFQRVGWRNTLRILGSLYLTVGMSCLATFVPPTPYKAPSPSDQEQDKGCVQNSAEACDGARIHSSPDSYCLNCNRIRSTSAECDTAGFNRNIDRTKCVTAVDTNKKKSPNPEVLSDDSENTTLRQRLYQAITYPELWILGLAVIIIGILDCFYYINMVSYMISVGFTESDGARVLSIMGASTTVGKLGLSLGGELLPFPAYYLLVISALLSSAVICSFLFVRNIGTMLFLAAITGGIMMTSTGVLVYAIPSAFFGPKRYRQTMPVIFFCNGLGYMCGSLIGQSIDRTGSYRSAILISIGVYIFVTCLFIAAPLYQRTFAPDRYVVQELHRLNRLKKLKKSDEEDSCKIVDVFKASGTKLEITYERVSSV